MLFHAKQRKMAETLLGPEYTSELLSNIILCDKILRPLTVTMLEPYNGVFYSSYTSGTSIESDWTESKATQTQQEQITQSKG